MAIAISVDARGDSSHRKKWVLSRWSKAMCRRNWFHYFLRVCTELQVLSKTASRLWFYTYKKYKNGNFARRTYLQRHIRPPITQNRSDNFSSGISGKLPKIATSNVIFSRQPYCIAAKFYMTIEKIKPNDIFQNCVHSFSTLDMKKIHDNKQYGLNMQNYLPLCNLKADNNALKNLVVFKQYWYRTG